MGNSLIVGASTNMNVLASSEVTGNHCVSLLVSALAIAGITIAAWIAGAKKTGTPRR
jgi:hypothetical protein